MELRQLEYLVAVAREASFTKAAARLFVAQPGVSAQIRRLERELGQELLDRSGRRVRLTEVGAAVLPHAQAVLDGVAGVRGAVDELTGLMRGRVTLGTVASCAAVDLPGMLAEFHKAHPEVEITLTEATSDRLFEGLLGGELDLAVVGLLPVTPEGIALHPVAEEPIVVAVTRSDPLAEHAEVTLDALAGRALITMPRGTGLRACLDAGCAEAGFAPQVAFEASDPAVLTRLAVRGLGPAVLPESLVRAHAADLHAVTVTNPRLRGGLALAWREEGSASPAARVLVEHARATLPQAPADRVEAPAG